MDLVSLLLCTSGSGRTLRDGPLESSPIVRLLREKFISSWSLVAELKVKQLAVCNRSVRSASFSRPSLFACLAAHTRLAWTFDFLKKAIIYSPFYRPVMSHDRWHAGWINKLTAGPNNFLILSLETVKNTACEIMNATMCLAPSVVCGTSFRWF